MTDSDEAMSVTGDTVLEASFDCGIAGHYDIRGLRVETAGQAGQNAGTEGDLVGVVDAMEFRDAVLRQRQAVLGGEQTPAPAAAPAGDAQLLAEIRDILARIEGKLPSGDGQAG